MNLEALDEERKKVFKKLKGLSFVNSFDLAGGTALAMQIGHRISFDFDFFSQKLLPKNFLETVEKELKDFRVTINSRDELTGFLDNVKVTFLYYPFPKLLPSVELDGIKALSILEIAATKAYTIGRRSDYKDYVDMVFLLSENHVTLEKVVNLCEKKYGEGFNSRLFLEQLIFEEDVTEIKIHFLRASVSKEEIFSFFNKSLSNFPLK
jgi:hypothetical protein